MKRLLAAFLCLFLFLILAAHPAEPSEDKGMGSREEKLREQVSRQIEEHWELVCDPAVVARTSMLLQRLLPYTERDLPYEVRIVQEETPNAFAIPGGLVYLTSGMIDFCRSDDELSGIIAHELTHTDKNHIMTQVARNQKLSLAALLVIVASKGQGAAPVLANLAQVAIMNSYSRDLEREADLGGLDKLHSAGYSPAGMVTVMERLSEEQLKHPWVDPGIYMDHPDTKERIGYLVDSIRRNGWPLHRKDSLKLLRTDVSRKDGYIELRIDGDPVWACPETGAAAERLTRAADILDESFQMELAPYDIQVMDHAGSRVLRVGRSVVATLDDVERFGLESLDDLRESLLAVLQNAKIAHPMGKYLQ